jgi:membrane associated rhomboid family serine protease
VFILGDNDVCKLRIPWVTWSLIAVCALVFGLQSALGPAFTSGFSLVPAEICTGRDLVTPQEMQVKVEKQQYNRATGRTETKTTQKWVTIPQAPGPFPIHLTLLTSQFLHGDIFHLVGNMWFLFLFGRSVEQVLRPGLFLTLYLGTGVLAGLAHVLVDTESVIPCLGASGAISGVLGAYFFRFPMNRLRLWMGWYFGVVRVPAFVVLGLWFLIQYLLCGAALDAGLVHGGVAYWCHVAGFVAGLLFFAGVYGYFRYVAPRAGEAPADAHPPAPAPADPLDNFMPPPLQPASAVRVPDEGRWR